jgi:hypothetical protein
MLCSFQRASADISRHTGKRAVVEDLGCRIYEPLGKPIAISSNLYSGRNACNNSSSLYFRDLRVKILRRLGNLAIALSSSEPSSADAESISEGRNNSKVSMLLENVSAMVLRSRTVIGTINFFNAGTGWAAWKETQNASHLSDVSTINSEDHSISSSSSRSGQRNVGETSFRQMSGWKPAFQNLRNPDVLGKFLKYVHIILWFDCWNAFRNGSLCCSRHKVRSSSISACCLN